MSNFLSSFLSLRLCEGSYQVTRSRSRDRPVVPAPVVMPLSQPSEEAFFVKLIDGHYVTIFCHSLLSLLSLPIALHDHLGWIVFGNLVEENWRKTYLSALNWELGSSMGGWAPKYSFCGIFLSRGWRNIGTAWATVVKMTSSRLENDPADTQVRIKFWDNYPKFPTDFLRNFQEPWSQFLQFLEFSPLRLPGSQIVNEQHHLLSSWRTINSSSPQNTQSLVVGRCWEQGHKMTWENNVKQTRKFQHVSTCPTVFEHNLLFSSLLSIKSWNLKLDFWSTNWHCRTFVGWNWETLADQLTQCSNADHI